MNEELRKHVTSNQFVLTMRATHIRTLVFLHVITETASKVRTSDDPRFVASVNGLRDRGLVLHFYPPKWYKGDPDKFRNRLLPDGTWEYGLNDFYELTTAGYYVVGLLEEAGMYEPVALAVRGREKVGAP